MWEIDADADVHYRCHVGHAYSAETMNLALDDNLCRALLRALEERVALTEKLRNQAGQRGDKQTADLWARKKAEVEQEAEIVRKAILRADRIASAFAAA
jgi:two-component system, chemotaxis family, protein-glutamate methylesterase/glutaminase